MNLKTWLGDLTHKNVQAPLLAGFVAGILAVGITLTMPNTYESEARILPADARGVGSGLTGQLAAAAAVVGVTVPGQETADAVYVDILSSRWLRERLLEARYQYHYKSWRFGSEKFADRTLLADLKCKNIDLGVKALKSHITVTRDIKTKLITVIVETHSAELSQQVARKAIAALDNFIMERTQTKGGAKAAFTEQRLKEARTEYATAEDEFRTFLEHDRNYQMSNEPGVRLKGLRLEAEMKLRQQLLTTLAISYEQALLEEKNDMPILNVLDNGNLPIEKSGPPRALIVLITCVFAGFGMWAWQHWAWIKAQLKDSEPSGRGSYTN